VTARALARDPGVRVLFFMGGLHALRVGGGQVQTGGTRPVSVTWLAARLAERYPQDVYTILTDAAPSRAAAAEVAAYRGTAAADVMRRGGMAGGSAFRVTEQFDVLGRSPVRVTGTTGLSFTIEPRSARFSELADAYIYLGN
jgi:hypothetical protein